MSRIRQAEEKDIKHIKKLCDEYISRDFYSEEELKKVLTDDEKFLVLYVNDEDIPVAFIYMYVAEYGKAKEILKIPDDVVIMENLTDASRVGVFKTTATDAEYRRHGILNLQIGECERIMRDCNVPVILLDALKIPSGEVPAESGIRNNHFKEVADIEHPWLDTDSYCPYCRNRFCTCNAVLFMKEIDKDGEE